MLWNHWPYAIKKEINQMVNVYNTLSTPYSYNLLKKTRTHTSKTFSFLGRYSFCEILWHDKVTQGYLKKTILWAAGVNISISFVRIYFKVLMHWRYCLLPDESMDSTFYYSFFVFICYLVVITVAFLIADFITNSQAL